MARLRTPLATAVSFLATALALAGCGDAASPTAQATPVFGASTASTASTAAGATGVGGTPGASITPAPSGPSAGPGSATGPAGVPESTTTPGPLPTGPFRYVFPVRSGNVDFHSTHAKYPATDIFAGCGQPVVAVLDGTVLEVSLSDHYVKGRPDGPLNGGLSVSLLGDDGVRYYGSHLRAVQTGIKAGVRVRAGQQLGVVGHTGNANGVCHLHFGISPPCARTGDWDVRRGVIWPAPFLTSWRGKGTKSPVSTVTSWQRTHSCRP